MPALRDGAPEATALAAAAGALRAGELVVLPTDTVYGVAADPQHPGALDRLARAKGRPDDKPVALLAADLAQVEALGARPGAVARTLAARHWPGALTLVLAVGEGVGAREEGFRVPDHPVALALLRAVGHPLRVSSANLSGGAPARTAAEAVAQLGASVALVLDAGPSPGGAASTVVRLAGETPEILRAGPIPAEAIRRAAAHPSG